MNYSDYVTAMLFRAISLLMSDHSFDAMDRLTAITHNARDVFL